MLAVARDHLVATPTGPRRADTLAAAGAWHQVSGGNGAKGRRWYDWALFAATRPEISLLVRRSVTRPSELAFYRCHTPRPASTTTRSGSTRPGTGTSPSPCSPWPGSLPPGQNSPPRAARRNTVQLADHLSQRDPPPVHRPLRTAARRAARPPLVTMAPPPPRTRPALPLPATTPARSLSEAGVLIRKVRCSPAGVAGEGGAAQRTDAAQGLALTTTELHVGRVGMVRVALDPYVSVLPLVTDALGRRRCAAGVAQAYSRLAVTAVRRALHHVTTPRYSILPDSMTSMNPACEMPVGDQTFSFSNASSLVLNCGH